MLPELFTIPFLHIPVHGFGLMMVLGFYFGMILGERMAKHVGMKPGDFSNAAVIGLIAGVIGARLSHILENLGDFTRPDRNVFQNLWSMVNLTSGGLTYYGGFLLATPVLIGYAIWKKIPVRIGMDIVAPCLMIGLGLGRVGCFLNGCCYGAECNAPWAVSFPYGSFAYNDEYEAGKVAPPPELYRVGIDGKHHLMTADEVLATRDAPLIAEMKSQRSRLLHPAQLYSTITAMILATALWRFFYVSHAPGRVFALMMMLEGVGRYTLEILRVEPPVVQLFGRGLSLSMVLSVGLVSAGALLWVVFGAVKHERADIDLQAMPTPA